MTGRACALLLGSLLVSAGALRAAGISVALTVTEEAGLRRQEEIAAGGVPFPRGAVKDATSFGVLDENGKPVPAQFTVLGRWPSDGSIRWMLVEFPVSLPAGAAKRFTLKEGAENPKPARPLAVTVGKDGRVSLEDGRDWGPLFDAARLSDFVLETVSGGKYTTGNDAERSVVLEESGPLRATVRIDARHRNAKGDPLFACRVRISYLWNGGGLRLARVQYTFTH